LEATLDVEERGEPGYVVPDLQLVGAEHVQRYQQTGGRVGHIWNGVRTLLLTTTGRRTGQPRISAMIYGTDGGGFVVVASNGGSPGHPAWYLNIEAQPRVELQVRSQQLAAVGRTVTDPDERTRLWQLMVDIWPNYDVYQQRTDRRIPLVVLTPTS